MEIAQNGVTIVSGLALGIDTAAHKGALEAGGRTIVVLANGIDSIYPHENTALANQIIENDQGIIITEYPPGAQPIAKQFPVRARLISGLSLGTLIVEAPEKSGAMHTVTAACEQGREVFAVPGNIDYPNSAGPNRLIQDGAKPAVEASDILDELKLSHQLVQTRQETESIAPDDETDASLLSLIRLEPLHINEIAIRADLPVHEVSTRMTLLHLRGQVKESTALTYMATKKGK